MIKSFLVLLLAHLIADFWLQTKAMVEKKNEPSGILLHAGVHFASSFVLSLLFSIFNRDIILSIFIITTLHALIDYLKIKIQNINEKADSQSKVKGKNLYNSLLEKSSLLFIVDQLFHFISIYITLYFLINLYAPSELINRFYNFLFGMKSSLPDDIKVISLLIVFVILLHGCAYLIGFILEDAKRLNRSTNKEDTKTQNPQQAVEVAATATDTSIHQEEQIMANSATCTDETAILEAHRSINEITIASEIINQKASEFLKENELENKDLSIEKSFEVQRTNDETKTEVKGKIVHTYNNYKHSSNSMGIYIGMLERTLIAILVVKSAFTGIAFIGAVKTLARFKQFDEKDFAEEYLLGTLLSALFGFIGGHIISRIL